MGARDAVRQLMRQHHFARQRVEEGRACRIFYLLINQLNIDLLIRGLFDLFID